MFVSRNFENVKSTLILNDLKMEFHMIHINHLINIQREGSM